jgi:hypothetical protein
MDQYERLMVEEGDRERYIDTIVHTTSAKQATAQILKTLGVEMNWVFEDLKKSTAPPAH